jgi:hypothetical protein
MLGFRAFSTDSPSAVARQRIPVGLALAAALCLVGCADTKPGQSISGYDLLALDPANAASQAILGPDGKATILSGRGAVESSLADATGWSETSQGAQPKVRRFTAVQLADGREVRLYESNPANEELGELVLSAPGGSFESLAVKGRNTDLAAVQREVNALYTTLAPGFIKATEAERDAIIRKLQAQENVSKAAVDQVVPMLNALRALFPA